MKLTPYLVFVPRHHKHKHIYIYIYMRICIYVSTHTYYYAHTYVHVYVHTHTYTRMDRTQSQIDCRPHLAAHTVGSLVIVHLGTRRRRKEADSGARIDSGRGWDQQTEGATYRMAGEGGKSPKCGSRTVHQANWLSTLRSS